MHKIEQVVNHGADRDSKALGCGAIEDVRNAPFEGSHLCGGHHPSSGKTVSSHLAVRRVAPGLPVMSPASVGGVTTHSSILGRWAAERLKQ